MKQLEMNISFKSTIGIGERVHEYFYPKGVAYRGLGRTSMQRRDKIPFHGSASEEKRTSSKVACGGSSHEEYCSRRTIKSSLLL